MDECYKTRICTYLVVHIIIFWGSIHYLVVFFLQGALIFILFIPVSKQVRDLQQQIKIRDTLAVKKFSPHSKSITRWCS